jgi:hypothetical protein
LFKTSLFDDSVFNAREDFGRLLRLTVESGAVAGRSVGSDNPTLTLPRKQSLIKDGAPSFLRRGDICHFEHGIVKYYSALDPQTPYLTLGSKLVLFNTAKQEKLLLALLTGYPKLQAGRSDVASWHGVSVGLVEGACTTSP